MVVDILTNKGYSKKETTMKKIFLAIILMGTVLLSCDQENIGTLFDNEGNDYVAVGTVKIDEPIALLLEDNFSFKFPLHRTNLSINGTTAEVELSSSNGEGVFMLESSTVTFADGEGVAHVVIVPVSSDGIDPATTYSFTLTVVGDNASPMNNEATFSAQMVLEYTPLGEGYFYSEFWPGVWEQAVEKANGLELYKAVGLYESGKDILFSVSGDKVVVAYQKAWNYDASYGDVYASGEGTVSVVGGKTLFTVELEHYLPSADYSFGTGIETLELP